MSKYKEICSNCKKLDFDKSENEHFCRVDFELKPIYKRPFKCDAFISK